MSNQRVIVLTGEEIEAVIEGLNCLRDCGASDCPRCAARPIARAKLIAALRCSEGVTDDMVRRGCNYSVLNREDVPREDLVRGIFEAGLFPGEDER